MFWKDFLYIYVGVGHRHWNMHESAPLQEIMVNRNFIRRITLQEMMSKGKIEENTVNSGIFNGCGDKGIGSIVEHDVFDRFYGDKSVKYRALKETIAKTWKHIQRTRDLGDYLGVVV